MANVREIVAGLALLAISSCLINPKDYPVGPTGDAAGGGGAGSASGPGGAQNSSGRPGSAGESAEGGNITGAAGQGGSDAASEAGAAGENQAGASGNSAPTHPSCAGLPAACGGTAHDDCCLSPTVTGGTFTLGGTSGTSQATITTFALDKYEVTVARFRTFVTAYSGPPSSGAGAHPSMPDSGWQVAWNSEMDANRSALINAVQCSPAYQTWKAPSGNGALPMNCVNWFEAFAFCAWDGGWLPTEAEWEYAAAGGSDERTYPWGDAPVPDNTQDASAAFANYQGLGDGSAPGALAFADILPVGSKPLGVGKFGHMDLAGSVWEWALDYSGSPYPAACNDCANLTPAGAHVLRGGSWNLVASYLPTTVRNGYSDRGFDIGFRCARAP